MIIIIILIVSLIINVYINMKRSDEICGVYEIVERVFSNFTLFLFGCSVGPTTVIIDKLHTFKNKFGNSYKQCYL